MQSQLPGHLAGSGQGAQAGCTSGVKMIDSRLEDIAGLPLCTINRLKVADMMYVDEYEPFDGVTQRYRITLVHGDYHSGQIWLMKPDGQPGWAAFFLQRGYRVSVIYLPGFGTTESLLQSDGLRRDLVNEQAKFLDAVAVERELTAPEKRRGKRPWVTAASHNMWPGTGQRGDPIFEKYKASMTGLTLPKAERQQQAQITLNEYLKYTHRLGGGETTILIGHGTGCTAAWLAADVAPQLVAKVVAVEPAGPPCATAAVHTTEGRLYSPYLKYAPNKRMYGLADIPLTFDPPAKEVSAGAGEQALDVESQQLLNNEGTCMLQKTNPNMVIRNMKLGQQKVPQLVNLKQMPHAIITGQASFHAIFDWASVRFMRQAGVSVDYYDLADKGIVGNGHLMMMEMNSNDIALVAANWIEDTDRERMGATTKAYTQTYTPEMTPAEVGAIISKHNLPGHAPGQAYVIGQNPSPVQPNLTLPVPTAQVTGATGASHTGMAVQPMAAVNRMVNRSQMGNAVQMVNGNQMASGNSLVNGNHLVSGNHMINGHHAIKGTHMVNGSQYPTNWGLSNTVTAPEPMAAGSHMVNGNYLANGSHVVGSQYPTSWSMSNTSVAIEPIAAVSHVVNGNHMVNGNHLVNGSQVINENHLVNGGQIASGSQMGNGIQMVNENRFPTNWDLSNTAAVPEPMASGGQTVNGIQMVNENQYPMNWNLLSTSAAPETMATGTQMINGGQMVNVSQMNWSNPPVSMSAENASTMAIPTSVVASLEGNTQSMAMDGAMQEQHQVFNNQTSQNGGLFSLQSSTLNGQTWQLSDILNMSIINNGIGVNSSSGAAAELPQRIQNLAPMSNANINVQNGSVAHSHLPTTMGAPNMAAAANGLQNAHSGTPFSQLMAENQGSGPTGFGMMDMRLGLYPSPHTSPLQALLAGPSFVELSQEEALFQYRLDNGLFTNLVG